MTVYVGNLSYEVTEADLNNVFTDYGTVKKIKVPMDRETGRMRGFAFIEMSSEDEEVKAIEELDGAEWLGRTLKVNKARPRTESKPSGGGGWGNNQGF
ncbi:MAG: RNA recognition motif domain-containing protein [Prochlorothrix sp.]|nr:RNA-binding protein [Prochlorothrix sp.]